jgi:hypothetical protein
MTGKVPICIQDVDDHESGLIRWRRVRVCVRRVHFQTDVALVSTQSKEYAHARLFDAARVGVSQLELRSRARGAVTTVPRFASVITFDSIVPVLTKENRVSGSIHRFAIHILFCHGIELLKFGVWPLAPVEKASKFPSSEASKTLLHGRSMCRRIERAKQ